MPFLRLNLIHGYSIGMNAIDLSDRIRNTYSWDLFMRERKWSVINNDVVFTDATS